MFSFNVHHQPGCGVDGIKFMCGGLNIGYSMYASSQALQSGFLQPMHAQLNLIAHIAVDPHLT
jgi:hypothetical protein